LWGISAGLWFGVIPANGQIPNADSRRFNHDDRAAGQRALELGKMPKQQLGECLWSPRHASTKQDEGRLTRSLNYEQCAEVGVCGHDHPPLVRRSREDDYVLRALEVILANMNCVVTMVSKKLREERG